MNKLYTKTRRDLISSLIHSETVHNEHNAIHNNTIQFIMNKSYFSGTPLIFTNCDDISIKWNEVYSSLEHIKEISGLFCFPFSFDMDV